jgi:hypothetical protein
VDNKIDSLEQDPMVAVVLIDRLRDICATDDPLETVEKVLCGLWVWWDWESLEDL